MTNDEIVYLINAHYATSGEINDVIIFARAIEHCTLTKQKARWYQEGVEAGNTQSQELSGKTKRLKAEIKRLQELADYRLKLLTKMPSTEPIGEIVRAFGDLTAVSIPNMPPVGTKLYAAPPKREWVSLTDAEIAQAVGSPLDEVYLADFRKVEAKLKEKNHA